MRVGLVLGAGGVMGGAWLTGGMHALATETRWDPASADYVVGTSAGSVIGSLCAAGVPPWFMVAHSRGESFEGLRDARGRPAAEADRDGGAAYRPSLRSLPIGPGSWRLALATLRDPSRYTPVTAVTGWLPQGLISTAPISETIRRAVPSGWPEHPNLWVVASDYETGRRVPFGREDAPPADLAEAVAASCSIPAFYRPVEIGGRRYVDGGIYSTSNLDIVRGRELDLVICLNPTSSLHPIHAWNPLARLRDAMRDASGRRLGSEAKKLRSEGTEVVLIQPLADDLEAMGPNLMSRRGRDRVIETAIGTVAEQLRRPEVSEALSGLPPGEDHKIERPPGDPSTWPPLRTPAGGMAA